MSKGYSVVNKGNSAESKNYAKGNLRNPSESDYDKDIVKFLKAPSKKAPKISQNISQGLLGHLLNNLLKGQPQGINSKQGHAQRTAGGVSITPKAIY